MKKDILFSLFGALFGLVLFCVFHGRGHGSGWLNTGCELATFAGTCFTLLGILGSLVFYIGGRIERK